MFAHPLADGAELRPLEPWQAAEFAEHVDRVRADIVRYVPFGRTVVDEESARAFLQRYADRQAADQGRFYGIWVDGVLRGGTLFRTFDAERGVCEAGVWLDSAVQGRGLVTTACRAMLDWAFGVRRMARVEWLCDPANDASIAVAKRLGMSLEGVQRKAYIDGGESRDLMVWAVLDDEWTAASGG